MCMMYVTKKKEGEQREVCARVTGKFSTEKVGLALA